ncbi:MAG: hypothetical protein ACJ776_10440 [Chloroflexota bacterium]|jgi:hypothetical protein
MPNHLQATSDDREQWRYERKILQDEVDYRRSRRSGIFTWASSILIAVTGGVMAIQLNSGRSFSDVQRWILSVAVVVLGGYAALWWEKQRKRGGAIHRQLRTIDERLGIAASERTGGLLDKVGGLVAIILLTMAAIAAIWSSAVAR